MNKKKLIQRIAVTVIGIPLVLSAIFFFPHYNHALFFLVVLFFSASGSIEIKELLEHKFLIPISFSPYWGLVFPTTAYISLFFTPSFSAIWTVFILFTLAVFSREIFRGGKDDFSGSLSRSVMTLFILFYPNLLTPFVLYLGSFAHTSFLFMLFFLLVFGNDVFAYVFGMIFGTSTRGIVKASPNKSIAGFLGGTAATVLISLGYFSLFANHLPQAAWYHAAVIGAVMSAASNLGDLFESAIKRSLQVKDSGSLMPGRGGILDTIDSIVFSAPVFYYLIYVLYTVV